MESDKRRQKRFSLELSAELTVLDEGEQKRESHAYHTRDISSSGAFFLNSTAMPLDSMVDIELDWPLDKLKKIEGKRAQVKLSGLVVRVEGNGMGVSFDEEYEISPINGQEGSLGE